MAAQDEALNQAEVDADQPLPEINSLDKLYWEILEELRSTDPAEVAKGRQRLKELADDEYVHAQYLLGTSHLYGSFGLKKKPRTGVNLIRLAAERGHAYAQTTLGSCYASGTGVWRNNDKAIEWLTRALAPDADYSGPQPLPPPVDAETANTSPQVVGVLSNDPVAECRANAHFFLASVYEKEKQHALAHKHYLAAANAGVDGRSGLYNAAIKATLNYAFGKGTSRDLDQAKVMMEQSRRLNSRRGVSIIHNYASLKIVDEFAIADLEENIEEASEADESKLRFDIASQLADRKSKNYDPAEAVIWYELAAESGQVWAMLELAFLYLRDDLGAPDQEKAFHWFEKVGSGDNPKHYVGVANLAISYQNGLGTPQNPSQAQALFTQHRDVEIVSYLGSIGQCPPRHLTFKQIVALNQKWAKKGDPHAQYLWGLRLLNGHGVKANIKKAERWFKKAAKKNHGGALNSLGAIYEYHHGGIPPGSNKFSYLYQNPSVKKKWKKAEEYYRRGSEAGNALAATNYGRMLSEGKGSEKNKPLAEKIYLRSIALDPDNGFTHNNLGVIHQEHLVNALHRKDQTAADHHRTLMLEYFEKAESLDVAIAARNLGMVYLEGIIVPQDLLKAYHYLERAADLGMTNEHYLLGMMHEKGMGMPVTYTEAAYHYRLAALNGHIQALKHLVDLYLTGRGVSHDLDRAIYWLQQLVATGDQQSLKSLCDILFIKKRYTELVPILEKIDDSTYSPLRGYANYRLSQCYREGLGVSPHPRKARKYFDEAIELENGDALHLLALEKFEEDKAEEGMELLQKAYRKSKKAAYTLGYRYYHGIDIEQNHLHGVMLIKRAASRNNRQAMYFLANLTYENQPEAPSLGEAIEYARRASTTGDPKAAELLQKLEQQRKDEIAPEEESTRSRAT